MGPQLGRSMHVPGAPLHFAHVPAAAAAAAPPADPSRVGGQMTACGARGPPIGMPVCQALTAGPAGSAAASVPLAGRSAVAGPTAELNQQRLGRAAAAAQRWWGWEPRLMSANGKTAARGGRCRS